MKKNGKNIITDNDITLVGTDIGENLSTVLTRYKNKLDQLESNIKWIYKNGGIGTGSGGGSGSSSAAWKIVVSEGGPNGNILVNNSQVNLSGIGNYTFCIQIYGGGQSSFKVTSSYVNSKGTQVTNTVISSADGFLWQKSLYLDLNGNLSLVVLNQDNQEVVTFVIPFVVTSHTFSLSYVYADTKMEYIPSNNTIFMNDIKDKGIQAALTYSISVGLLNSGYSYLDWEGNTWRISANTGITKTTPEGTVETIVEPGEVSADRLIQEKTTSTIYLDLCSETNIIEFLSNNENAKYTQFILNVDLTLEGNSEPETIEEMSLKDNLIPAGMYLKLTTSAGTLYERKQLDAEGNLNYPVNGRFNLGSAVFVLTPYYGSLDTTRRYNLLVQMGTSPDDMVEVEQNITQLSDQTQQSPSIPITSSGEHYISFTISAEGTSYTTGYYFFVKESTSNFNWMPKGIEPVLSSYYRRYTESQGVSINYKTPISSNINNTSDIVCTFDQEVASTYNDLDQLLTVGLQYSSINNTTNPILSFTSGTGTYKWSIFIYQNKITVCNVDDIDLDDNGKITNVEGESCEIFFPMTDDLDDSATINYHQLCIYKKFEKREGNNYWKGIYVYIDGVLEAALGNFVTVHQEYINATFYPGNYYVNELEYHCFQHSGESVSTTWLTDNNFISYYYTYYEKLLGGNVSENDKILYDAFNGFTCDDSNFVKTNSTAINNIAKASKIPVLVLSFTDTAGRINDTFNGYNVDNFKGWVSAEYTEQDELENLSVTAQWSDGKGSDLTTITKQGSSAPANFELTLQGSSTMSYRCKNFELIAPESNDIGKCIFTPNFNPNDPNSFLPEESFTLKADVVDSSHTNNNAMGKFINEISTPFSLARQGNAKYGNFIKNCLTGFPILLFIHTRYKQDRNTADVNIENYYFFGIYNFNLGRKSYFNLGYKDLTKLENLGLTPGFKIYEIAPEDNGILNSVAAAEIQGNNKFFDFSQYNETILYDIGAGDETVMFGDFVDGVSGSSGKYANAKSKISTFVKRVARAGGYAFKTVGKLFSDDPSDFYGYNDKYSAADSKGVSKNQVPNYLYQAIRSKSGTTNNYNFTHIPDAATERDLKELLLQDETGESNVTVGLDYAAVCEYYTICMAFGLVDSVQKNLNIKSWNSGNLFYPAFYDMDTCLGVSNSGSKISYFAFSDYWSSSTNSNGYLNEASVWRDYSPKEDNDLTSGNESESDNSEESNSVFFDIPSSYLFAVAKYAYPILKDTDLIMHPSNLWALWRNSARNNSWTTQNEKQKGCLANAEYFMDNYYNNHLAGVPKSAFNYNYKYKYFVLPENSIAFDNTNFPKFYGRKQAYTLDWLQGRLHILDAYFNLNRLGDTMNANLDVTAPIPDTQFVDSNNKDIYVLKDIFSDSASGNQYINLSAAVSVQAKPYAPLIIKGSNQSSRYIFPADGNTCNLSIKTDSNQFSLLGGSSLWTYLSSINPFITTKGTLTVKSDYFNSLIGTAGKCNLWNIKTPSLKTISLTNNSNFSGDLIFESTGTTDNFPNLNSINISGTKISLRVSNESITELTALNMVGGNIDIANVSTLTNVAISGTLTSLNIPAWKGEEIVLPTVGSSTNWKCNNITISNDVKKYPGNILRIYNNSTLTSLSFNGFEEVYIVNCPNLTSISITDTGNDVLRVLHITSVSSSTKILKIGTEAATVDLSKQKALDTLYMKYVKFNVLKLPNRNITFPTDAFRGCTNLKYLVGDGNYYITGTTTFYDCRNFTLRQKEDVEGQEPVFSRLFIHESCTDLTNTFNISNNNLKGVIDQKAAAHFLKTATKSDTVPNVSAAKVRTITGLFRNQNIVYTLEQGWREYKEKTCALDFSGFPIACYCYYVLYDNPIDFWNKYMFKGLGVTATSVVIHSSSPIIGERESKVIDKTTSNPRGVYRSINGKNYHVMYITIDALEFIIDKLGYVRFRTSAADNYWLYFIEPNEEGTDEITGINGYSMVEEVSMHDLFRGGKNSSHTPKLLRNIQGLEIFPEHKIDCTDWFGPEFAQIQTGTSYGLYMEYVFYQYSYENVKGLDKLFYPINVESIVASFPGVTPDPTTNNNTGRINMATFINWGFEETTALKKKRLGKMKKLFTGTSDPSIGFKKTITYSDFHRLWEHVLTYTTALTTIQRLFYNCVITGTVPNEFTLVDETTYLGKVSTTITDISNCFRNCTFSSTLNSTPQYLTVTHDFLKYLPNLEKVSGFFIGMKLNNPIPFDFFNKRKEVKSPVYIDKGSSRVPATLITYEYDNTLNYLEEAFYNVTLKSSICFDPEADYNKGSFKKARIVESYDSKGNEVLANTEEYYDSSTSLTKYKVIQPTEITDTENIKSHFSQKVTTEPLLDLNAENTSSNKVLANYNTVNPKGLFVAPDVLYGVANSSISLYGVFGFGLASGNPFTGVIPDNLLKNCKGSSIRKLLNGLCITPKFYDSYVEHTTDDHDKSLEITHNFYYYVPINFTEYTSLEGTFNFKLIIPPVAAGEKTYYTVFLNGEGDQKSIPESTSSLANTLPGCSPDGNTIVNENGIVNGAAGYPKFYTADTGIRYAAMGTPKYTPVTNEDGKLTGELEFQGMDWGLDLETYSNLKLNDIYNPGIMMFLYGNVIKEGTLTTWNQNKLFTNTSSWFIRSGYSYIQYLGMSYNAKLNLMPSDASHQYLTMMATSDAGNRVNINCIEGYDESNHLKYLTAYPKLILFPIPEGMGDNNSSDEEITGGEGEGGE